LNRVICKSDYKKVGVVLPTKTTHDVLVRLSAEERKCYETMMKQTREAYTSFSRGAQGYAGVLAMFTRLRQICLAASLVHKETTQALARDPKGSQDEWLSNEQGSAGISSSKLVALVNILRSFDHQEKVLIFSKFSKYLRLIGRALSQLLPEFKYEILTGEVNGTKRNKLITAFKQDPTLRILLINYKVGSEGLNLTEATRVINMEPWWNRAVHMQAEFRCWRTGQTHEVQVFNLVVEESIEQKVLEISGRKTTMIDSFSETDITVNKQSFHIKAETMGQILWS
jgi:SNF2 family DNA or RNA helicase